MHIQFATRGEIESSLYWVNDYFDQNIEIGKFVERDFDYFIVMLRVIDVNKVGHVVTKFPPLKRLPTACSHVHKAFFLELPDHAEVFNGTHWFKRIDGDWPLVERYPCECEEDKLYVPNRKVYIGTKPTR
jgi:hypothetical protein